MALYKEPIPALLEAIKLQNNGVILVEGEYAYGPPVEIPVEGDGTPSMVNTSMLITALNPGSPYDGQVVVKHRRLDLADLSTLVPTSIRAYNITTTLDVALRLNALYGTNFTSDDIVSSPAELTDGSGVVTLVAKPGSRSWIGTVDITVTYGAVPMESVITTTNLPGLLYPAVNNSKPFAWAYSYWRDFSNFEETLSTVTVGTDGLDEIALALFAVSGNTWATEGANRYSLAGATVTYAGDTSGEPEANTDYDKVIVVALSDEFSLGWAGSLYLHYNLPIVD